LKSGCKSNINLKSRGEKEMGTGEIYHAELRRLIRNLGMKYATARHKSVQKDPFNLFHFGQALAYEEAIEIIKKVFHDEMKLDEWE
jgi:hypothetical protein